MDEEIGHVAGTKRKYRQGMFYKITDLVIRLGKGEEE